MVEVGDNFERASSEAKASVGNGAMLIGRFIERPRHIELQLLDDKAGNVDHLYERDGPVERRHQKLVEIAPAPKLAREVRGKKTNTLSSWADTSDMKTPESWRSFETATSTHQSERPSASGAPELISFSWD